MQRRGYGPDQVRIARAVLARRFATLYDDSYGWEELWFRATVWDFRACVDYSGWQQPPYLPDQARIEPNGYGRYLQANHAVPHAVEVRVPARSGMRHGGRPRCRDHRRWLPPHRTGTRRYAKSPGWSIRSP